MNGRHPHQHNTGLSWLTPSEETFLTPSPDDGSLRVPVAGGSKAASSSSTAAQHKKQCNGGRANPWSAETKQVFAFYPPTSGAEAATHGRGSRDRLSAASREIENSRRKHKSGAHTGENKRNNPGDDGTFDSNGFVDEIRDRSLMGQSLLMRKRAEARNAQPEKPVPTSIYGEDDPLLQSEAGLGQFDQQRYLPLDPKQFEPDVLAALRKAQRTEIQKLGKYFAIEDADEVAAALAAAVSADEKRNLLLNAPELIPQDDVDYDVEDARLYPPEDDIKFGKKTRPRTAPGPGRGAGQPQHFRDNKKKAAGSTSSVGAGPSAALSEKSKEETMDAAARYAAKAEAYPEHHNYSFEDTTDLLNYKFDPEAGADPPDLVRRNILSEAVYAHSDRAELWLEHAEKEGIDLFARPEGEYVRPFEQKPLDRDMNATTSGKMVRMPVMRPAVMRRLQKRYCSHHFAAARAVLAQKREEVRGLKGVKKALTSQGRVEMDRAREELRGAEDDDAELNDLANAGAWYVLQRRAELDEVDEAEASKAGTNIGARGELHGPSLGTNPNLWSDERFFGGAEEVEEKRWKEAEPAPPAPSTANKITGGRGRAYRAGSPGTRVDGGRGGVDSEEEATFEQTDRSSTTLEGQTTIEIPSAGVVVAPQPRPRPQSAVVSQQRGPAPGESRPASAAARPRSFSARARSPKHQPGREGGGAARPRKRPSRHPRRPGSATAYRPGSAKDPRTPPSAYEVVLNVDDLLQQVDEEELGAEEFFDEDVESAGPPSRNITSAGQHRAGSTTASEELRRRHSELQRRGDEYDGGPTVAANGALEQLREPKDVQALRGAVSSTQVQEREQVQEQKYGYSSQRRRMKLSERMKIPMAEFPQRPLTSVPRLDQMQKPPTPRIVGRRVHNGVTMDPATGREWHGEQPKFEPPPPLTGTLTDGFLNPRKAALPELKEKGTGGVGKNFQLITPLQRREWYDYCAFAETNLDRKAADLRAQIRYHRDAIAIHLRRKEEQKRRAVWEQQAQKQTLRNRVNQEGAHLRSQISSKRQQSADEKEREARQRGEKFGSEKERYEKMNAFFSRNQRHLQLNQ